MANRVKTQLERLFEDVSAQFLKHAGPKTRAASVGEIWSFVQEQLDIEYQTENPDAPMYDNDGYPLFCPSYVLDVYLNDKGSFALVTKSDGKLYKVPVTVDKSNLITLGDFVEVFMEALPVTGREVKVARQADGEFRWFAMPACTAVVNRSGEIDSTQLFDSFIAHIMRTGEYPELDFYHMGESILLGKADFVFRDGVAYCATGTFYDSDIARAAIKALEEDKDYWGLSIAYTPTSEPTTIRSDEGVTIPVYNSGVNRFISLLPEKDAASILTAITQKEVVSRMNEKVLEAIRKLTGNDEKLVGDYQMKLDTINKRAAGMISRDGLSTNPPAVATPAATAPVVPLVPLDEAPAPAERAMSTEDMTALLDSPDFEARVTQIINEIKLKDAQATVDATAAMQENARAITQLRTQVNGLTSKVSGLVAEQEEEEQQLQDDMPAGGKKRTQIVRPRAIIAPIVTDRSKIDMAARAAQTLQKLEAQG